MKVSFSRKGFDSGYGGQPNAILPDGTLLPFPIPSSDGLPNTYDSLFHEGLSLYDIISSLNIRPKVKADDPCHLDPDLCKGTRNRLDGWEPSFGQADQSLSELKNHQFTKGDLFLFFGWFRETEFRNDRLVYKRKAPNIQMIYGYMQVGSIIKAGDEIPDWLSSHPHATRIQNGSEKDAIFLPTKVLSFAPQLPGASMLRYSPQLILTAPGMSRSKWRLPEFFRQENIKISHVPKQPEDLSYFQSASIGQEMIWEATDTSIEWLTTLCKNQ